MPLMTLRAYKSASVAALFVAKVCDPTRFFMCWRPDPGADSWSVAAVPDERVPADRERLSILAPEATKGFFVALNEFFSSTVAIQ
jgi:hypothetical protein